MDAKRIANAGLNKIRKANIVLTFVVFACILLFGWQQFSLRLEAQRTAGRIATTGPAGFTSLCQASIPIAGNSIGPCVFPPAPTGKQWRKLVIYDYVSGYGGGGDTVGYRFNGDSGANYRYECNTMAPGGTTFALGTNTAVNGTVVKLAPSDTTLNRNFQVEINNSSELTEKSVLLLSVTGTGSTGTQTSFDLCNGAWISASSTSITSITSVTLNNNMGANSGFAVFGIAW